MKSQKKIRKWHGQLGSLMKQYLALRKSLGRVSVADLGTLHQLNLFMQKRAFKGKALNREVIVAFLASKKNLNDWGKRNYIIAIRQFCSFLKSRGVRCYSPTHLLIPKLEYQVRFHHYTSDEVISLMKEAKKINPSNSMTGLSYSTLIGLFWSTGMRKCEPLKLNHSDVDLDHSKIMIRNSKFRKSRMIPIHPSVTKQLRQYVIAKKSLSFPVQDDDPFFVNAKGLRISSSTLSHQFHYLVCKINLPRNERGQAPRLHDLRHSFATNTLKSFYKNPKLPHQNYLPVLATYLGHSDLKYSQYYLHPDFELLTQAGKKLAAQFKKSVSI